jgi:DedD protein
MKQRLVGAIVLGCLAIIFLPILLDGEGVSPPEMNIVIPAAPTFPDPLELEPQRPIVLSDTDELRLDTEAAVVVVDAIAVDTSGTEQELSAEFPELNLEGLPQAWSVRLGLFGDSANAETLIAELLGQGYRAYSDLLKTTQGELTAVLVGPVLTRVEAEALRIELSSNFNLDALIVDFNIDDANQ